MKYFFLAGLPRSGNTLLSSILNQNPKIKVSANSFLCDVLFDTFSVVNSYKYVNFPDEKSLNNLIHSVFPSYYKDWDANYIIDRGPWGTPSNLELLKRYVTDDIKIICTVRDIVEILASFIHKLPNYIDIELQKEVKNGFRFEESYKTDLEIKCEWLTSPKSQLDTFLLSLHNLLKEENKKYIHIVEYNDLIMNTKDEIDKIYKFLNIEHYDHKYHYINDYSVNGIKYDDAVWGSNLHQVKHKIKLPSYNIEEILPKNIIQKYSNLEFWRK